MRPRASIVLAFVLCTPLVVWAQAPIAYRLSFPAPEQRWMQVEMTLPELPAGGLELHMSRSSPGRYALHDFSKNVFDVEVSDGQRAVMHKISRDAYRAIGAEGFARIDFLLAGDRLVLSEINTIPGFTPISLFPTMPAEGGYTFEDVCERIVALAVERRAARVRRHLGTDDLPR